MVTSSAMSCCRECPEASAREEHDGLLSSEELCAQSSATRSVPCVLRDQGGTGSASAGVEHGLLVSPKTLAEPVPPVQKDVLRQSLTRSG